MSGPDSLSFLQGLISNDIRLLDQHPMIHAALLTPQGKFLHDFFITRLPDGSYQLECEGGARAKDLWQRLNQYKLRAKIICDYHEDFPVCVTVNSGVPDPRHPALGQRCYTKPQGQAYDFSIWDKQRILLAIADGSRDAEIEKSTLAELNMNDSISYTKGCYVGQELTARIHNRGLLKRALRPIDFGTTPLPALGNVAIIDGREIGEMRSACGTIGLVLAKIENE